jgi:hypothetical protein
MRILDLFLCQIQSSTFPFGHFQILDKACKYLSQENGNQVRDYDINIWVTNFINYTINI